MRDGATTNAARSSRSAARPSPSRRTTTSAPSPRSVLDDGVRRRRRGRRARGASASSSPRKLGENIQVVGAQAARGRRRRDALASTCTRRRTRSACSSQVEGRRPGSWRGSSRCTSRSRGRRTRTRDEVPAGARRRRARDPLEAPTRSQSKPEDVREKIVEGMLNKRFFAESVLGEQTWIHDDGDRTVAQGARQERGSSSSTTPGSRSADGVAPSASQPARFERVLLKLSGEALMGAGRVRPRRAHGRRRSRSELVEVHATGLEIALVIGGGNIYRGMKATAAGDGPRDRRLHGHARDGLQLARRAGGARAATAPTRASSRRSTSARSPSRTSAGARSATSRRGAS